MSKENQQTLTVYENHFDHYIDGTVQVSTAESFQGQWLIDVLKMLPLDARILEVGSAFGRDVLFIESLGYKVQASDATEEAVKYLNDHDIGARKLNVVEDTIDETYDLIIAAAVFLHFTEDDLKAALKNIGDSLTDDGILAFSVKNGSGESWSDHKMGEARYFHFWNEETIRQLLKQNGFLVVDVRHGPHTANNETTWLHVIARKGEA